MGIALIVVGLVLCVGAIAIGKSGLPGGLILLTGVAMVTLPAAG